MAHIRETETHDETSHAMVRIVRLDGDDYEHTQIRQSVTHWIVEDESGYYAHNSFSDDRHEPWGNYVGIFSDFDEVPLSAMILTY